MKLKQVIVLRKDLNMRKGKMVAQGAHACVSVALNIAYRAGFTETDPEVKEFARWLLEGATKICVSVDSEEELRRIYKEAQDAGIITSYIVDKGTTEFHGEATPTAVAIGPADAEKIDKITGKLKLL